MCNPASFVVTKGKVFWSLKTDSHEDIIEEFGLVEKVAERITLVRVEISPENGDLSTPVDQWVYRLDQDIKPDWYDAEDVEKRCRFALTEWYAAKIIDDYRESINDGDSVYLVNGGTIKDVWGGTINAVWGGTINAVRGGTIKDVRGGTINDVSGGTIKDVNGGTINNVRGGTINDVYGGTVTTYNGHIDQSVITGDTAVLIDRSGDIPVCYGGKKS